MPDERRRRSGLAALALVALVAAGCGTTVPTSELARAQSASPGVDDGLSAPGNAPGAEPGAVPGGPADPVPTTGSDGPTTSPTSPGGGPSAGPVGPASGPSRAAAGGTIKIGALTVTGAGEFQKSLGFSGATGDQTAMTKSVVNWINAHGGFGGRKVQLVQYDLDTGAYTANPTGTIQAACTYFTQDNKVAAVASYLALVPENFYACMAKAHVPVVTPDEGVSAEFFQRYANTLYVPAGPSYTRLLADSVDQLWNAGWLTKSSVVGVVGYDTVDVHSIVSRGLEPALRRHGLKLNRGMYTAVSTSAAGEYSSGVLSFKAAGVDRVFFAPGGQPIYFALMAQTQGYHPFYELGSLEYPSTIAANLPAQQLSGSMGLGWLPYFDLPSNAWPSVVTPGMAECRKAVAAARQDFSGGTTLGIAAWICDDWMFLRDVFAKATGTDEAAFRRAADALGSSFRPAATFRSSYAPGRTHDGAAGYRLVAFDDGCACFRYRSPVRPFS